MLYQSTTTSLPELLAACSLYGAQIVYNNATAVTGIDFSLLYMRATMGLVFLQITMPCLEKTYSPMHANYLVIFAH